MDRLSTLAMLQEEGLQDPQGVASKKALRIKRNLRPFDIFEIRNYTKQNILSDHIFKCQV